jgi:hypothetical protein
MEVTREVLIDTLPHNDLIIIDLCRHRDYAEQADMRLSVAW